MTTNARRSSYSEPGSLSGFESIPLNRRFTCDFASTPHVQSPRSTQQRRQTRTDLDAVPEDGVTSASRSSTPSFGGSTRVHSRLSDHHGLVDSSPKQVTVPSAFAMSVSSVDDIANEACQKALQKLREISDNQQHEARVPSDTSSNAPPPKVNWLRILYRRFVVYVFLAMVSLVFLVVAYYTAPAGSHEPNIFWLHMIATTNFLALLIEQVNELVKSRGSCRKDLMTLYIGSVSVVVSMTVTAWMLYGFGIRRHQNHLLLIATEIFFGTDILFILLLAGRNSCKMERQVHRIVEAKVRAMVRGEPLVERPLPEINPHHGPYADFLHEGGGTA